MADYSDIDECQGIMSNVNATLMRETIWVDDVCSPADCYLSYAFDCLDFLEWLIQDTASEMDPCRYVKKRVSFQIV